MCIVFSVSCNLWAILSYHVIREPFDVQSNIFRNQQTHSSQKIKLCHSAFLRMSCETAKKRKGELGQESLLSLNRLSLPLKNRSEATIHAERGCLLRMVAEPDCLLRIGAKRLFMRRETALNAWGAPERQGTVATAPTSEERCGKSNRPDERRERCGKSNRTD